VNLFNMHQQEMLLIFANLGYFVACFLLYLWMSRPTQKAFPLRRTLTCYNLINVLISSFISFSILRYKLSSDEVCGCALSQHSFHVA
jgi:ABC-type Fe3+-siderophore transport system permease subunit